MTTSIALNQKQQISSIPRDADGNVAALDGPVTFVSSDALVATSLPAVDGGGTPLPTFITPHKVGTCNIAVTALQGGVPTVQNVGVTVTPDPIADMGIVLGTPVNQ